MQIIRFKHVSRYTFKGGGKTVGVLEELGRGLKKEASTSDVFNVGDKVEVSQTTKDFPAGAELEVVETGEDETGNWSKIKDEFGEEILYNTVLTKVGKKQASDFTYEVGETVLIADQWLSWAPAIIVEDLGLGNFIVELPVGSRIEVSTDVMTKYDEWKVSNKKQAYLNDVQKEILVQDLEGVVANIKSDIASSYTYTDIQILKNVVSVLESYGFETSV